MPAPTRVGWNVPRSIVAPADFHVVADLDVTELRRFNVLAFLRSVAEAVGADHGPRLKNDPVAEDRVVVKNGVRMQGYVVAETAVAADDRPGVQPATAPMTPPSPTETKGNMLASAPTWTVGWTYARGSIPCGGGSGRPCSFCTMATKAVKASATWMTMKRCPSLASEFGDAGRQGGGRHHGRRPACLEKAEIAFVLDEGDVFRPGLGHRPGARADDRVRVAVDLTLYQRRQRANGDIHVGPPFLPREGPPAPAKGGGSETAGL